MANTLLIFNKAPYDRTNITLNGLKLAEELLNAGVEIRIFLMNEAVILGYDDVTPPPEGCINLVEMLKEIVCRNVTVKAYSLEERPYFQYIESSEISELAQWIKEANKVISFS